MKLKTIKEMGNFTDAEISIYEKVKHVRHERNKKELFYKFYSMPIFYLIIFFSAIVSSFISLFLLFQINKSFSLIMSISFDTACMLLGFIFIINLFPIAIFLLSILCLGLYGEGASMQKEVEKEIYVNEGLPSDIKYKDK